MVCGILPKGDGLVADDEIIRKLHHVGDIVIAYCAGGLMRPVIDAIIVRNRVAGGVHSAQAPGEVATLGGEEESVSSEDT